ncbi:MAG: MFS transporter [Elusimicrobiota bacterium]|jgi:fucose permease
MNDKKKLVFAAFAVILASAFFDNIRGPLLPLFARGYGLNYSQASAFFWGSSLTSVLIGLGSVYLLARFSERAYLRLCLLGMGLAVLAAGIPTYPALVVSGLLWGANNGIGMASNLVLMRGTDDRNRTRLMSALHLFYTLGAALPPAYVAATAGRWAPNLVVLPVLLLVLGLVLVTAALPADGAHAEPAPRMPWSAMLRGRPLASVLVIAVYVLGEVLTSMWLVTYLSGRGGLSVADASTRMQVCFLWMSASRLLGAFALPHGSERWLPAPLMLGAVAGSALGMSGRVEGFYLAYFCFGPIFPLLGSRLAQEHKQYFPSLLSFAYAAMTVLLAVGHLLIGAVSDRFSLQTAFRLPGLCLLAAVGLLAWHARAEPARE